MVTRVFLSSISDKQRDDLIERVSLKGYDLYWVNSNTFAVIPDYFSYIEKVLKDMKIKYDWLQIN